ncbi:hypothetical protein AC1031_019694 [Aphanomyces cochlioides]|nr:hypothetical protein AC1031_019694 [Aphanomyces cochlioides]
MATTKSPRMLSPKRRESEDLDPDCPTSPTEYKRFSSTNLGTTATFIADDEESQVDGVQETARAKKQARKNKRTCCKCIRSWWRRFLFVIVVVGGIIAAIVWVILALMLKSTGGGDAAPVTTNELAQSAGRIADGSVPYKDAIDPIIGVNPAKYPDQGCKLPQYTSADGQIYVQGSNGIKIPIAIKGVSWAGMETGNALPYGLWQNPLNGTTVYQMAAFLSRNNFNSVRLPLCVESILSDRKPNPELINAFANKAIALDSYMNTLSSVVRALGYRKISVLLDMHVLTLTEAGGSWTGDGMSELSFLAAVDVLTTKLCNDAHWNVIGIDLKNSPYSATWGDGGSMDWSVGAATIANRMLTKCPNWLAFVQGVVSSHTMTTDSNQAISYTDWWGGGLQDVAKTPLSLSVPNKVVYAPHYYPPSEYPQMYFVRGGLRDHDLIIGFLEYDNETLWQRIKSTTNDMFGYLAQQKQAAIALSAFGGIYTQDRFANFTGRRAIEFTMDVAAQTGFAGGYVWNLNPESQYEYNPSNYKGLWNEGLVELDWITANGPYLAALQKMDAMAHLQPWPCMT